MANYEEVNNRPEERSVIRAGGFGRHGGAPGVHKHVVEDREEFDTVSWTGRAEHHTVTSKIEETDTVSRDGSVRNHLVKVTSEKVDTHHHGRHHDGHHGHHHQHGHHGHGVVRETTVLEQDFDSRTGKFHERRETFVDRED